MAADAASLVPVAASSHVLVAVPLLAVGTVAAATLTTHAQRIDIRTQVRQQCAEAETLAIGLRDLMPALEARRNAVAPEAAKGSEVEAAFQRMHAFCQTAHRFGCTIAGTIRAAVLNSVGNDPNLNTLSKTIEVLCSLLRHPTLFFKRVLVHEDAWQQFGKPLKLSGMESFLRSWEGWIKTSLTACQILCGLVTIAASLATMFIPPVGVVASGVAVAGGVATVGLHWWIEPAVAKAIQDAHDKFRSSRDMYHQCVQLAETLNSSSELDTIFQALNKFEQHITQALAVHPIGDCSICADEMILPEFVPLPRELNGETPARSSASVPLVPRDDEIVIPDSGVCKHLAHRRCIEQLMEHTRAGLRSNEQQWADRVGQLRLSDESPSARRIREQHEKAIAACQKPTFSCPQCRLPFTRIMSR